MNRWAKVFVLGLLALFALRATLARAANDTVAGELKTYTTIENAGFEWTIQGDDNDNCAVAVEYRKQGETAWKPAQPLWRPERGQWKDAPNPENLLAGSIFFLQPGTTYEARLVLRDADGGAAEKTVSFTTRTEPRAAADGRTRYVMPGTGGGTGAEADPFKGLAAADAAAQPGDIFILQPGRYNAKFVPTHDGAADKPIVYRGASVDGAVIDGNGMNTGNNAYCIDLNGRKFIALEGMTITNSFRLIRADKSEGIVVRGCFIKPIQAGEYEPGKFGNVFAIRAPDCTDLLAVDNVFQMVGDWPGVARSGRYGLGGYGLEVDGTGIIVCFNTFYDAWDAISFPSTGPATTRNCDAYNNLILRSIDDGVQADFVRQNIRVYRNRILNSGCALSSQPCFGGPTYYLYNEIHNARIKPYKYHADRADDGTMEEPSGMIAFHNTSICSRKGWNGGIWHHVLHRNNLILGALPGDLTLDTVGTRADLDYDGYNRQGDALVRLGASADGPAPRYNDLPAFFAATGNEQHGIEVTINEFVKAAFPHHPEWRGTDPYGAPYSENDIDLQLKSDSVAIDKGQVLANINDGFTGKAPDLGCYELGKPIPHYGTRIPELAAKTDPK